MLPYIKMYINSAGAVLQHKCARIEFAKLFTHPFSCSLTCQYAPEQTSLRLSLSRSRRRWPSMAPEAPQQAHKLPNANAAWKHNMHGPTKKNLLEIPPFICVAQRLGHTRLFKKHIHSYPQPNVARPLALCECGGILDERIDRAELQPPPSSSMSHIRTFAHLVRDTERAAHPHAQK